MNLALYEARRLLASMRSGVMITLNEALFAQEIERLHDAANRRRRRARRRANKERR